MFKILPAENAQDEASRLQAGHCFEVNIIASIRVDSKQFLEAMAQYYASAGWFRVDLERLLTVWLDCLDQEKNQKLQKMKKQIPSQKQDTIQETEETEEITSDEDLPEYLSFCDAVEAPLAKDVRNSSSSIWTTRTVKKSWRS